VSIDGPILRVQRLSVAFLANSRPVLDEVSFDLPRASTLGLVGESGSGKSTVGRAVLGLLHRGVARVSGSVLVEGRQVVGASRRDLLPMRRHAQIVFQDPGGSLNPRMRVADLLAEPFVVHRLTPAQTAGSSLTVPLHIERELLPSVGLGPDAARRYPHEFSGGQRQRLAIARAIALRPRLLILDEPTSALDVSIQAQVLNLLKDLQRDLGLAYLFISHDMGVIAHMSDRLAVMHGGRIVEEGERDQVLNAPSHFYTQSLLASVPELDHPSEHRASA
jgi:ABC-type microcin C transport system duplicated ATPase subunit YejF